MTVTRGSGLIVAIASLVVLVVLGALALPAAAHEERTSQFPPGTGQTPTHRTIDQASDVLVVCKPDSASRIALISDPALRAFNEQLLDRCGFEHLQAAVDAVAAQRTNIYVLPGHYREEPSWSPPCVDSYGGGIVDYPLIVSCGEVLNLVTIAGDDPADADIVCDNQLCNLQIEGTGADPTDVVFTSGFRENGDWVKHNILKADRADGIYLLNMTFELASENAVYVHETDGYAIDRVLARYNDLYGILTFTSDHGIIRDCETHHNGDSGIYPGSAADVNAASTTPPPLQRWSVEVVGCDTHHNALGFSGTAGNSVYFHDNQVHHNGAGYVTDSFTGGHPGMPQDHAWIEHNQIYSNNENYYVNTQNGACRAARPADVGYEDGVVCPAFPIPVGTGVLIAGGSYDLVRDNDIYDNWRNGVMLFWIPGAIRGDLNVLAQIDTSNGNRFVGNRLGFHPAGVTQPNGVDFWWDDQGVGNCWEGNVSATGPVTHNALLLALPVCALPSLLPISNLLKTLELLPCAQYNRHSNPNPQGCSWLSSPPTPAGRQPAPDELAGASAPGAAAPATAGISGSGAGSEIGAAASSEGRTASERRLPATGGLPSLALLAIVAAVGLGVSFLRRRRVGAER